MDKTKLAVLGAASGAVILGGVIVLALGLYFSKLLKSEVLINTVFTTGAEVFIVLSILFIIATGVIGLIAAFIQDKWMYLITWIVAGLSIFITLVCVLKHGNAIDKIKASYYICRSNSYPTEDEEKSRFLEVCDFVEKIIDNMMAIVAFFVLTLVAEVAELVVACYYFYLSMPTASMVNVSNQQPMLVPGQYMMPQANIQAIPVMTPQA